MKRSTVILIIFITVVILLPVAVVKYISHLSPEKKSSLLQEIIYKTKENTDTPTRYITIEESDDTQAHYITITTTKKGEQPGHTTIDGEVYEQDSMALSNAKHRIVLEEPVKVVFENKNPHISLLVQGANVNVLTLNTAGEIDIQYSNIGIVSVVDSTSEARLEIIKNNIGSLVADRCKKRSLVIAGNNIGNAVIPENPQQLEIKNNNITVSLDSTRHSVSIGSGNGVGITGYINIDVDNDK